MKPRSLLILAALLVFAMPFHAAEQQEDAAAAVCVANPVLDQGIASQIEHASAVAPVCHGACTYSTGSSTYSEPCNRNCKCPRTHNGNSLYQYSCDNGVEDTFLDDEAIGSLP